MLVAIPEDPTTFRQEIAAPIFQRIQARESCAIVSMARMGRSRLMRLLLRADVRQHYLAEASDNTLLVLVDCNRLADQSEWGLYELILVSLTRSCRQMETVESLYADFNNLHQAVVLQKDPLLARRSVESAVDMLCQEKGIQLCLLFDQFDKPYQTLPSLGLANLRALRDNYKLQLCYVLTFRDIPERLRDPAKCQMFYELFSRSILGLKSHTIEDAYQVLANLAKRKSIPIAESAYAELIQLSGGHPGLLVALFDVSTIETPHTNTDHESEWPLNQITVQEECQKIWAGLNEEEQLAISRFVRGISIRDEIEHVLLIKGIIYSTALGDKQLFSPLFTQYVANVAPLTGPVIQVDSATNVVWVGGREIPNLTPSEFRLMEYLFNHLNQVCTREQIIYHLYTEDSSYEANDNRIDSLVKRLRSKIETGPSRQQYLQTVRGKGYKLAGELESTG